MKKLLVLSTLIFFFYTELTMAQELAHSQATPLSFGIFPPAQFPPSNFYVRGIRVSGIMGSNRKMSGIDLGLIGNRTEQEFRGLAVAGIFNNNSGISKIVGAQIAGLVNRNVGEGAIYGIQAALLANNSKYMDLYGLQFGIYNRAREVYGLQIGIVNHAANLHGIQIGLANFNAGGTFGVSPIINVGW